MIDFIVEVGEKALTFNSLFEMRVDVEVDAGYVEAPLSILYLRCSNALAVYEMFRAAYLSILYLRCWLRCLRRSSHVGA